VSSKFSNDLSFFSFHQPIFIRNILLLLILFSLFPHLNSISQYHFINPIPNILLFYFFILLYFYLWYHQFLHFIAYFILVLIFNLVVLDIMKKIYQVLIAFFKLILMLLPIFHLFNFEVILFLFFLHLFFLFLKISLFFHLQFFILLLQFFILIALFISF
jgi:hypothetical protein